MSFDIVPFEQSHFGDVIDQITLFELSRSVVSMVTDWFDSSSNLNSAITSPFSSQIVMVLSSPHIGPNGSRNSDFRGGGYESILIRDLDFRFHAI